MKLMGYEIDDVYRVRDLILDKMMFMTVSNICCNFICIGGVCNGKYNSIFTYSIWNYVSDWYCNGNTYFIFQYQEEESHSFNYIFNNTYTSDLYSDAIHCWDPDFTMHADNCFDI